jgi:hypothetical protein
VYTEGPSLPWGWCSAAAAEQSPWVPCYHQRPDRESHSDNVRRGRPSGCRGWVCCRLERVAGALSGTPLRREQVIPEVSRQPNARRRSKRATCASVYGACFPYQRASLLEQRTCSLLATKLGDIQEIWRGGAYSASTGGTFLDVGIFSPTPISMGCIHFNWEFRRSAPTLNVCQWARRRCGRGPL